MSPLRPHSGHLARLTSLARYTVGLGLLCAGLMANSAWAHGLTPGSPRHAGAHSNVKKPPARARVAPSTQPSAEEAHKNSAFELALQSAHGSLALYRQTQDERHLDRAQTQLSPWLNSKPTDARVWVLHATVEQTLHRFDSAMLALNRALAIDDKDPQAWLTVANLHRMAARYDNALSACASVERAGQALYAQACEWEIRSLQGEHEAATAALQALGQRSPDRAQRAWLFSLLAEAFERAGKTDEAARTYRASLALVRDPYTLVAYADHLLDGGHADAAQAALRHAPTTDAVALRQLRAQVATGKTSQAAIDGQAQAFATRLASSIDTHGREAAYLALWVRADPATALPLALDNLKTQREPIDWKLAIDAAKRQNDSTSQAQLRTSLAQAGLRDLRLAP